ncbi:hypothetical protein B0T25DRAFT_348640 [Lasiosphaeria hispida]|uniref:Uncharacterized protein n=1 Tax=Lasiosphaeria hispida TaxID=260671 RepID=A0AAJ0H6U4_9PEZI|nr:hypothetical protein B0T25DRAFT_348640 [Lasiosphaeria hispida]
MSRLSNSTVKALAGRVQWSITPPKPPKRPAHEANHHGRPRSGHPMGCHQLPAPFRPLPWHRPTPGCTRCSAEVVCLSSFLGSGGLRIWPHIDLLRPDLNSLNGTIWLLDNSVSSFSPASRLRLSSCDCFACAILPRLEPRVLCLSISCPRQNRDESQPKRGSHPSRPWQEVAHNPAPDQLLSDPSHLTSTNT